MAGTVPAGGERRVEATTTGVPRPLRGKSTPPPTSNERPAPASRRRRAPWVVLAALTCPCHVPIYAALLSGTVIGPLVADNIALVLLALGGTFVPAVILALRSENAAGCGRSERLERASQPEGRATAAPAACAGSFAPSGGAPSRARSPSAAGDGGALATPGSPLR